MKEIIIVGVLFGIATSIKSLLMMITKLIIKGSRKYDSDEDLKENINFSSFFCGSIFSPLTEEMIFRLGPIEGVFLFTNNQYILWIVIIFFSFLFALDHKENYLSHFLSGILFALAYIYGESLLRGYLLAAIAHSTNNIIFYIAILLKQWRHKKRRMSE